MTPLSSVTRINNIIQKKKSEAKDIILKLHEKGVLNALSVTALRDKIVQNEKNPSFIGYGESLVADLILRLIGSEQPNITKAYYLF